VITKQGDGDNSITTNNFDLAAAKSDNGYLGIKLSDKRDLSLTGASVASNPYTGWGYTSASLALATTLAEKSAQSIKLFFNEAIQAGDKIVLSVIQGQSNLLKLITGAESEDLSSPVTLTLAEGQTEVALAIENAQAIDSDQVLGLQVTWTHGDSVASSNTYTVDLKNSPDLINVLTGDDPEHQTSCDN